MRNQSLIIWLLIAIVFRHIVPFVDLFLVVLACFLLAKREQMLTTSYLAVAVSVLYTFILESPIGLLPLILSISLFLFLTFFKKGLDLGIAPLIMALMFIGGVIALESFSHTTLVTGKAQLLPQTLSTIFWSSITMIISTFVLSFKQKL